MDILPPKQLKQTFLEDNNKFSEIQSSETKNVEGFSEIHPSEDEIWLLQCPKGFDIEQLQNRKLKFPGRIKMKQYEAVALETPALKTTAFGFSNRKHHYGIKILPVTGKIILREQSRTVDVITQETIEASCPSSGPVPLPECIKVRHPLLGAQYEEYMKINKDIMERLQTQNDNFSVITNKKKSKANNLKLSPQKRIHSSNEIADIKIKSESSQKTKRKKLDSISEDLQWLKQL